MPIHDPFAEWAESNVETNKPEPSTPGAPKIKHIDASDGTTAAPVVPGAGTDAVTRMSDFLEALQTISEAAGAFNRDPVVHAQNCIRDMQAVAITVLRKHRIEPRGKSVEER